MIYGAFDMQMRLFEPFRDAARMAMAAYGPMLSASGGRLGRETLATWELVSRMGFTHTRPAYGIDSVVVGNREVAVTEVPVHSTAFGTLLSVEPAFGVLIGLVILAQSPTLLQVVGIAIVVLAGVAAQQDGRRNPELA